jgi:hypothetical protein
MFDRVRPPRAPNETCPTFLFWNRRARSRSFRRRCATEHAPVAEHAVDGARIRRRAWPRVETATSDQAFANDTSTRVFFGIWVTMMAAITDGIANT